MSEFAAQGQEEQDVPKSKPREDGSGLGNVPSSPKGPFVFLVAPLC